MLEGAHQTDAGPAHLGQSADVLPVEEHRALGGALGSGDDREQAGLAGTVGADQRVPATAAHAQRDVVDRGQCSVAEGQFLEHEDVVPGAGC